jgi:hypothetical protein
MMMSKAAKSSALGDPRVSKLGAFDHSAGAISHQKDQAIMANGSTTQVNFVIAKMVRGAKHITLKGGPTDG